VRCGPRYLAEPAPGAASPAIEIAFPDGAKWTSDDAHVGKALSDYLGRPVSPARARTGRQRGGAATQAR
jgi:hypothetical protein